MQLFIFNSKECTAWVALDSIFHDHVSWEYVVEASEENICRNTKNIFLVHHHHHMISQHRYFVVSCLCKLKERSGFKKRLLLSTNIFPWSLFLFMVVIPQFWYQKNYSSKNFKWLMILVLYVKTSMCSTSYPWNSKKNIGDISFNVFMTAKI